MADTKISALTDGATADSTDKIPVERAGANRYITPGYISTFLGFVAGVLPISKGGTGNTSGTATVNANLTGPVTSVGNATAITDAAVSFAKTTGVYSIVISDVTLANSANAQAYLTAAVDTLTVEAATLYEFETVIEIEGMGGTTRTTSFLFGGTATFTSCTYWSHIHAGVANAVSTAQSTKFSNAATAQALAATNTLAAHTIKITGHISINGGGTIIPQIQFSADPTGTILAKVGTYFKATPIGTNATASVGAWA